jgi:hypothetical protein
VAARERQRDERKQADDPDAGDEPVEELAEAA